MHIRIDRDSDKPIFLQIVEELERLLASGEIADGARLPASRDLARQLRVNRNTVVSAYQELVARGHGTAHTGRGTFARAVPPGLQPEGRFPWESSLARAAEPPSLAPLELPRAEPSDSGISFAANVPPEDLLPVEEFRSVLDETLARDGAKLLAYGSPAGHLPLREWIAAEMSAAGGPVGPDEIVVTTGSQQGIDLCCRALLDPGDLVATEEPAFALAIGTIRSYGGRVQGLEVDGEGVRPELLERMLRQAPPKLIYLVPNFHNPTGVCLSAERRGAVVELAGTYGVPIVEDDFAGPLRFAGAPLPSLRSLDARGQTLYLSTFSKMLLPGLRVGWMCVPPQLRDRIVALKQLTDCTTSLLLQAALHEFCRRGLLTAHLDRVRGVYRERRDATVDAMRRHFPPEIRWTEPDGGLILWVTLPAEIDAREVLVEARARGVAFNPGELFYAEVPRRNHLRLTFAENPPERIRRGIRILGEILQRMIDRRAVRDTSREEAIPLV